MKRILLVLALWMPLTSAVARGPANTVGKVLRSEPYGNLAKGVGLLKGNYEAGGAPGSFSLAVDFRTGKSRSIVVTGPVEEQAGFDRAPWVRHDGVLLEVDLPGAVADARAQAFLLRLGWRDPAVRRFMRPLGQIQLAGRLADGVSVRLPGASAIELWFGRDNHRPIQATVQADAGPMLVLFSEWRLVNGISVPLRREIRDATGQTTIFNAKTVVLLPDGQSALARPGSEPRGKLLAPTAPRAFVLDHGERGHIVVAASINGRPAKLVFDTGAANYFTPEVAGRYGLAVAGGVNIGGVGNSSFTGGFTRVRELAIGSATLRNSAAMVAPLPRNATNPRPGLTLQGLVGFEFLSEFRTTIDYGRRTIEFSSFDEPFPRGNSIPFRTDGNSIYIEASVEGRRGWFRLDTGDGGSITLFKHFAAAHGFSALGERRVTGGEAGGEFAYREATLRTLSVAGATLKHVEAQISEQNSGAFGSRTVAGNIGFGLLSRFRIVIDYRAKRILLTPTGT